LKHKLTVLTSTALLAIACGIASAQQRDNGPDIARDGQTLVVRAAQQMWQQPSIEARIRQQIDLFGQQLVGSGVYLQKRSARGPLLRLELKLGLGDQLTTLQQISDGRFLWICRDLPSGTTLSSVDLNRIRLAFDRSGREPPADSTTTWIALGGLPKLLSGLAANFEFGSARPAQLGETRVWASEGIWKPEKLAEVLPNQKDAILAREPVDFGQLAAHLPSSVFVILGQEDLMPYRVEFRRLIPAIVPAGTRESASAARLLAVLELFDVRCGLDLDERHFVYQPAGKKVADHTDLYLQNLGLSTGTAD